MFTGSPVMVSVKVVNVQNIPLMPLHCFLLHRQQCKYFLGCWMAYTLLCVCVIYVYISLKTGSCHFPTSLPP